MGLNGRRAVVINRYLLINIVIKYWKEEDLESKENLSGTRFIKNRSTNREGGSGQHASPGTAKRSGSGKITEMQIITSPLS